MSADEHNVDALGKQFDQLVKLFGQLYPMKKLPLEEAYPTIQVPGADARVVFGLPLFVTVYTTYREPRHVVQLLGPNGNKLGGDRPVEWFGPNLGMAYVPTTLLVGQNYPHAYLRAVSMGATQHDHSIKIFPL